MRLLTAALMRFPAAAGVLHIASRNGAAGYGGGMAPATLAQLANPPGIAIRSIGNLYFSDCFAHAFQGYGSVKEVIYDPVFDCDNRDNRVLPDLSAREKSGRSSCRLVPHS
jgi:hypothetical protein